MITETWATPRSSQPFILPRSIKLVLETQGEFVVKSKLSPISGSVALRQLDLIPENGP